LSPESSYSSGQRRRRSARSVVRGDPEGGVDSSRSALCEGDALVVRERRDEIGGGIEPDMSIDGVFGAREAVDERDERRADVGATRGENRVAFADERGEESIAGASRSRISASVMGSASWRRWTPAT
jgi:hypothetical protein